MVATLCVMKGAMIVNRVTLGAILPAILGVMIVSLVIQYAILPTVVVLVVKAGVLPAIVVIPRPAISVIQAVNQVIVQQGVTLQFVICVIHHKVVQHIVIPAVRLVMAVILVKMALVMVIVLLHKELGLVGLVILLVREV